jgi:glycolate oxidase iron-sulfur subunit
LQRALLTLAFRHVLPYPLRLRALARFGFFTERSGLRALIRRIAPSRIKEMDAMLPPLSRRPFPSGPELLPAIGERRAKVGLLGGCAMGFLFADVSAAAARVLRLNGCDVWVPKDHGCCGALNVHYGERSTAAAMARRNIDAFLGAGLDAVIVSAAGCGAAMKEYGHLLGDDPAYAEKARRFSSLVKDFSEFLAGLGLRAAPGRLELRATYQDPCHLAHGQRVRAQPRALLSAVPGLELIEMAGADQCCGSAGIYNLTHPEMAQELLQNKMAAIARTGAQAVVAPNPGCMMQLAYGARRYGPAVEVFHLADLLDRAYAGEHR